MKLHYKSCGISNVWLLSGYKTHETKYGKAHSYEDIDGLYQAITIALCTFDWKMPPEAIRFLRKRLGYSQEEFGKEFGCTSQAVAKWEKGTSGIPVAVDKLVRLFCLERFAPSMLLHEAITLRHRPTTDRIELEYIDSKWVVAGIKMSRSDEVDEFFEKFENGNQLSAAYVDDLMIKMTPAYANQSIIFDGTSTDSNQSYSEVLGSA
jgi:transcriptional regulator with XRE-family HTH domain